MVRQEARRGSRSAVPRLPAIAPPVALKLWWACSSVVDMARIFRAMRRDGNAPVVGSAGDALGVRVAPHACHARHARPCRDDVHPNGLGIVSPESSAHPEQRPAPRAEGMSVAPDWRALPYFKIPSRLQHLVKKARGGDHLFCWETGAGPFMTVDVGDGVRLCLDGPRHGVLAPTAPMHVDDFQGRIKATRPAWKIIEEDPLR